MPWVRVLHTGVQLVRCAHGSYNARTGSAFSGRICELWLMKLNVQEVDQGLGRVAPST